MPMPKLENLLFSLCLIAFFPFGLSKLSQGFSVVSLIHRESPFSPFYNPNEPVYERSKRSFARSYNRPHQIFNKSFQCANLIYDHAEYLMEVGLGTPPTKFLVLVDTGSDTIWTQCLPCQNCFPSTPFFNPGNSSTYKILSCSSKVCANGDDTECKEGRCRYSISYQDGTSVGGVLATETLTLGSSNGGRPNVLQNIAFGCGDSSTGQFYEGWGGIVGLGRGKSSLISQMSSTIRGKFSYCLLPPGNPNSTSTLYFGSSISGQGVVSTPLVLKLDKTFYSVTLEGFTIGTSTVLFSSAYGEGNTIVDSGTFLTLFPKAFCEAIREAFRSTIGSTPLSQTPGNFKLCYNDSQSSLEIPSITAHFRGADVVLSRGNTFVEVAENIICLAIVENTYAEGIFGSIAQTNFLMGFNLRQGTLSFRTTDCSNVNVSVLSSAYSLIEGLWITIFEVFVSVCVCVLWV